MLIEPTHVDREVFDLVLTDVPDVVVVRVSSPVGTSDQSAVFIDFMLEQLFHIRYVGRRFISRTLWSRNWLEEM